jgi:hypothetical protein
MEHTSTGFVSDYADQRQGSPAVRQPPGKNQLSQDAHALAW